MLTYKLPYYFLSYIAANVLIIITLSLHLWLFVALEDLQAGVHLSTHVEMVRLLFGMQTVAIDDDIISELRLNWLPD